ncbi:MAG: hypothetical protein QQN63_06235 [Nitrosopumilus sp.]
MFVETKNAFGLVYLKTESIVSIVPSDVRESKSDSTRLVHGACVRLSCGDEIYVLDTPMSLFDKLPVD